MVEGAPTLIRRAAATRLFVMTLRYWRRSFRRVVWQSSQQVWAQLHEEAFRYFGGVPSYVVLDFITGNKIEHQQLRRAAKKS